MKYLIDFAEDLLSGVVQRTDEDIAAEKKVCRFV